MSDGVLDGGPRQLQSVDLARGALVVLEANWLGHGTRPSLLYPHQWSWDSAFVAMGYAPWNQTRAETELRSLFAGQWENGLLPHIVFAQGDGQYFPGPEFWQSEHAFGAPTGVRTSGIVQPPIHATAALRLYRQSGDRVRAEAFLAELAPKLAAWHEYLYRDRMRSGDGLVEIWHPWESGMDNSPLWDEALARLEPEASEIPAYRRVDVELADPAERPTDAEYDRYVYLVELFRRLGYRPDRIRDATPFALQPVLFNALLVQANRDLAEITRIVGGEPERFERWATQTAAGLERKLWSEDDALYVDYDVTTGEHVAARSAAGLAPLYAGVPSDERAQQLVERLADSRVEVGDSGWVVTSLSPGDPGFQPTRYWRGPIWPVLNWVLQGGLDRYGYSVPAAEVRRGLIALARRSGFWEHYDPRSGDGHGGDTFAWTAGIVLDTLSIESEAETEAGGARMEVAASRPVVDGTHVFNERRD